MARPFPLLLPAAALAAAFATAPPAFAQLQSMPMPPSASDPSPTEHVAPGAKAHRSAKPARRATRTTAKRGDRTGAPEPSSQARTAPNRAEAPAMQLEDDPRVAPQLSPSGRPGVGVKF